MNKNHKIQLIRAILALAVVAVHIMPDNDALRIIIRPLLNIAVAGFIFLSGYLTKLNIDTKKFYRKRILAVLIPYVLFTIIYTVISDYKLGAADASREIAKNLVTTSGKYTLYYLAVYVQLVLLTPLLTKIADQKSKLANAIILLIQPLFIACLYFGAGSGVILKIAPFYIMFFPAWLSYYYLGLLIGNNLIKIKAKSLTLVMMSIAGIALQITEGFIWLNNSTMKDMYFSQIRITALLENIPLLLLMTRYIRSPREKCNKLLCKIGDASFGIYLLHPAFIMVCDKLIPRSEATFLITFAFAAAGSFATVLILNKLLPRKALKYTGLALK